MDDKQVRDEILTLFVAGHETTANGLAWSIYLLARASRSRTRARARRSMRSAGARRRWPISISSSS